MNHCLRLRCAAVTAMLALTVAILPVAAYAQDAQPTHKPLKAPTGIKLTFRNDSDRCAWLTPYWGLFYTPYSIIPGGPRMVNPHSRTEVGYAVNPVLPSQPIEIKVMVEITRNADCSGGTQKTLSEQNKGLNPHSLMVTPTSVLSGTSPNFHLSQPQ
jgi:hypothetical protein